MQQYDFDSLSPRRLVGSVKWRLAEKTPDPTSLVYPFSIADMDFQPAPEIKEALQQAIQDGHLGYFEPQPAYYAAIRRWFVDHHACDIQPDWVIQVPNIVYALYQLVSSFSQPGDGVIIQPPVYAPFFHAVERQGRKLVFNPLKQEGPDYAFDLADLEAKAKDPRVRLLLLCSPHNPVGRAWTRQELEAVTAICIKHQVLVISDEIHADLVFKPHRHTVLSSLGEAVANQSFICTAPSKSFNLPGLSTANLIIPNPDLRKRFLAGQSSCGISGGNLLGTVACQAAYEKGRAWHQAMMAYLTENRALLTSWMARELPQLPMADLQATFLAWLDLRALGMGEKQRQAWLEANQLYFLTGSFFGPQGRGFERLNLALPQKALQAGLERLSQAVKALDS